jgi:type I restriction enzyme S subunit
MKQVRLKDCCTFYSGGTPTKSKAEYWKGNIPWFSPKDIKKFELSTSQDCISQLAIDSSTTRLVEARTLLVVGRSGVLAHTLPIGITQQTSTFNQDIKAIVPSSNFYPEYVAYYLMANQQKILKEGVKRGPTVHSLISDFIEELEIPLLAFEQQRLIATQLKNQLAEVETVRKAVQAQWEEVQQLKSKALESVLAGVSNWQPMGCALRVQSGYAFKSEAFKRSGVRLLRNANILPGKVYWDDTVYLSEDDAQRHANYVLHAGDVLISLDRPIISSGIKVARVQATDLPALLLQRVGRFVLDTNKLDADYLYAYLQTERFMAQISGHEQSVGVPHISPGQVEAALMPLPDLTVQKEMAKRLTQITEAWSDAVAAIRKQGEDLAALPQRLLAQAFNDRGET